MFSENRHLTYELPPYHRSGVCRSNVPQPEEKEVEEEEEEEAEVEKKVNEIEEKVKGVEEKRDDQFLTKKKTSQLQKGYMLTCESF